MACTEELRDVEPDGAGRRVFELLQSVVARDTCWNESHSVQLNAGDILVTRDKDSGHRGNVIFTVNGAKNVILPGQVLRTRYPGDLGLFDPNFLLDDPDPNMSATDPRLAELDASGRPQHIPYPGVTRNPSPGM